MAVSPKTSQHQRRIYLFWRLVYLVVVVVVDFAPVRSRYRATKVNVFPYLLLSDVASDN